MRPPKKPPSTPMVMPIRPETMVTVTPISIEMRRRRSGARDSRGRAGRCRGGGAGSAPSIQNGDEQALAEVLGEGIVRHEPGGEDRADQRERRRSPRRSRCRRSASRACGAGIGTTAAALMPRSRGSSTAFSRSASMVSADVDHRQHQHDRLHHREVVLADALPGEEADAVQGEDLLDHDRAAQHEAELHGGDRHHRDGGVAQRVLQQDRGARQALGARGADVVASPSPRSCRRASAA